MKIVALDGATANPGDNPWTEIENLGEFTVYPRTTPDQVVQRAASADIVLTNKVVLDEQTIQQLPNLKFIAVTATGYNGVDVEAAAKRNVPVSNVPVYSTESVAQHVFASLLAFIHRPEQHHHAIEEGEWQRRKDFAFWLQPTFELRGKTIGIVGMGRIGRAVARIADAFGMKAVAHNRTPRNPPDYEGFEWVDLETLFSVSDVVSLHCPQTEANTGFVDARLIGKMKSSALIVNTARGGLINETDLAEALNSGVIAGAILDVLSAEPISSDNPLRHAKNCLLTPHMAWATLESRRALLHVTAQNIAAFQNGHPINVVL